MLMFMAEPTLGRFWKTSGRGKGDGRSEERSITPPLGFLGNGVAGQGMLS
jgi:hypothetical protein